MAAAAGLWQALARLAPRPSGGDGELLDAFAATRDGPAFQELMRRHGRLVWSVCRRHLSNVADAEDAFQATWLVLAAKPRAVRRGESLPSWLHGVAWRVASRLRQQRRRERPEVEVAAPEAPDGESLRALDEELARLPAKFRGPLVACALEERTQDDVAAALGLSVSTVQRRLAAGRELLRARLTRRGVELGAALALLSLPARDAPAALVELTLSAATTGIASAAITPLVTGVLVMIWHAKLKSAAVGVGLIALTTAGVGTVATFGQGQAPGGLPGGPPAATKPAALPPVTIEAPLSDLEKKRRGDPNTEVVEQLEFDIARAKLQIERAELLIRLPHEMAMGANRVEHHYEVDRAKVAALQAKEDKLVAERALKQAERQLAAYPGNPKPVVAKPAGDVVRKLKEKRLAAAEENYETWQRYLIQTAKDNQGEWEKRLADTLGCSAQVVAAELDLSESDAARVSAWRGQQKRLKAMSDTLPKDVGVQESAMLRKLYLRDAELHAEIRLRELGVE